MKTTLIAAGLGAALAAAAGPALADWPERPVTIVVSQSAGASPDILARVLAEGLSDHYGTQFVVDNRPGGANVVGALSAAQAEPDGHTLFFATSAALVMNPYLLRDLPYDPEEDFDPVARIATSHIMVVANPDSGIETIEDLLRREQDEPGSISVGVDSPRNLSGLIARALSHEADVDLTLVSYTNIPQSVQDAVAGEVPVIVQSSSVVTPFIREGSLHPVAVASAERSQAHPDVPAISETVPGVEMSGWFMMVAPEGTDPEIIESLNEAIREVLARDTVVQQAESIGFELQDAGVEESQAFLTSELENWGRIVRGIGVEPE